MNWKRLFLGGLASATVILAGNRLMYAYVPASFSGQSLAESFANILAWSLFLGFQAVLVYAVRAKSRGEIIETALTSGVIVLFFGALLPPFVRVMSGTIPARAFQFYILWNSVQIPLAAVAGAKFYSARETAMGNVVAPEGVAAEFTQSTNSPA